MRDFYAEELCTPPPSDLIDELVWEDEMDKVIVEKYSYME
jgi:hypothetical protein